MLDTGREPAYDAVTALAAQLCDAPLASVSLMDAERQWFKSSHGLAVEQLPRDVSFCNDVVAGSAPILVVDASQDPRYADSPIVTGPPRIRAYAGVPLIGRDGLPLGALAVYDRRVRAFTGKDVVALCELADHVIALLEQRRRDWSDGLLADSVLAQARDPLRLRAALEAGELVPHYQPLVDLRTGQPHGLEALLRWENPQVGTLSPAAFLPVIEASALVVPVGRAVLDAALQQVADLRRLGRPLPGRVAVNVASGQLARPGLARDVLAALSQHAVEPGQLALEITETTALPDIPLATAELQQLAGTGVQIVIDDYGVGWSNLSRILQLPVGALKLDRSIVSAVGTDPRAATMVRSTLMLAEDLGLEVVAEGVETQAVRRHLIHAGCRWAQGWLFSAAVPGRSLPNLLMGPDEASPGRPMLSLVRDG